MTRTHRISPTPSSATGSSNSSPRRRGAPRREDYLPESWRSGPATAGSTEPLLARGFEVTGTEVSRAAIERLHAAYGANSRFKAVYDASGDTDDVQGGPFTAVVTASVLHHIPDYLSFVYAVG